MRWSVSALQTIFVNKKTIPSPEGKAAWNTVSILTSNWSLILSISAGWQNPAPSTTVAQALHQAILRAPHPPVLIWLC
jgi:hypothetical protein